MIQNPAKYLLKAPTDDMARWKAAAKERQVSFAAFVRAALDHAAEEPLHQIVKAERVTHELRPFTNKNECPRESQHRKGSFCKTCGKIT